MTDDNDTTKLVIFALGTLSILTIVYLIFKDSKKSQESLQQSLNYQALSIDKLASIEKLLLEQQTRKYISLASLSKQEDNNKNNTVSMKDVSKHKSLGFHLSNADKTRDRKQLFDMK